MRIRVADVLQMLGHSVSMVQLLTDFPDLTETDIRAGLGVYQVRKRWEEEGQRQSLPMGGHRRSRIAHKQAQIRQWIEATPDLTLVELSELLAGEGISIKVPALWHQLDKWGLSFKKNPARQRAVTRGRAAGSGAVDARSAAAGSKAPGLPG